MKGFQFVDFGKDNQVVPQFSKDAKQFRTVHPGYNYEAKCHNNECGSNGIKVICPMMADKKVSQKIRVQNLSYDILQYAICPVCKEKMRIEDIKNIYFWRCNWELHGQLNEVEKQNEDDSEDEDPGLVHNQGTQEESDRCKTFNGSVLQYYQWIQLTCTILPNI